jgi:hypothetical protein
VTAKGVRKVARKNKNGAIRDAKEAQGAAELAAAGFESTTDGRNY